MKKTMNFKALIQSYLCLLNCPFYSRKSFFLKQKTLKFKEKQKYFALLLLIMQLFL